MLYADDITWFCQCKPICSIFVQWRSVKRLASLTGWPTSHRRKDLGFSAQSLLHFSSCLLRSHHENFTNTKKALTLKRNHETTTRTQRAWQKEEEEEEEKEEEEEEEEEEVSLTSESIWAVKEFALHVLWLCSSCPFMSIYDCFFFEAVSALPLAPAKIPCTNETSAGSTGPDLRRLGAIAWFHRITGTPRLHNASSWIILMLIVLFSHSPNFKNSRFSINKWRPKIF